ncbi:hypothetical protein SERLA73DRAFT_178169 [Serpula lacrymans var. lacrymans S7.3]|uniref:ATPase AAA-type core domain-containing protein n=2 Tax=Serpula lacrymans var. lacrymans TaxID=341189 RepID=F8PQV6_SERL3|nr:uncharacterized protein SERLADRAFT_462466 [Serpula lacrymans var. lacrymans S7.9]EGO02300.1 hypothetical protein SERLA73DRAFT_178169 [Serpula lacrymans var. lacrymans S7.3]EGO28042.1 hypothetical protein SERLADRAFT_462466 [Serpula lacrymans var. lacrymans S7.9]
MVSSAELSTQAVGLERNLIRILRLATVWDAIILIDEADVYLEQRSFHQVERNALVSVALRLLEYHRGVVFLTTNRIKCFDDAFLSRFSIAIKYPNLEAPARLLIWQNFFRLAGCVVRHKDDLEHRSDSPDSFVEVNEIPKREVSFSDLEDLSKKPFNGQSPIAKDCIILILSSGRTIKNLVRTAQALAVASEEPLSIEHVKIVVHAQEKFFTEFAS